MDRIGLFYGTDTGNTETVSNTIKTMIDAQLGADTVDVIEIYKKDATEFDRYRYIIVGMPTWYDGELQGDWETFLPKFETIDFKGKKIAFFGLGDQYGYSFYFCDALGIFYTMALKNGAEVCGKWPTDGYEYDACKAEIDGTLVGLCIDIDNQDDLTQPRLDKWVPQVLKEFGLLK
jgi:flavodoxin long chain